MFEPWYPPKMSSKLMPETIVIIGVTPQKWSVSDPFLPGPFHPGDAGSRQLGGPGGTAVHVAIVVFSCQAPCQAFVPYPWASS